MVCVCDTKNSRSKLCRNGLVKAPQGEGQIGFDPPTVRPLCLQVTRKQGASIPGIGAQSSLPGMTDLTDFFSHAWQTIGRAIAEAGLKAGLREVPETVSKTVKRRCLGELKRLGILLRRLIFLMALHVQLAPVKPRLGSNYFEKSEGDAESKYTCSPP